MKPTIRDFGPAILWMAVGMVFLGLAVWLDCSTVSLYGEISLRLLMWLMTLTGVGAFLMSVSMIYEVIGDVRTSGNTAWAVSAYALAGTLGGAETFIFAVIGFWLPEAARRGYLADAASLMPAAFLISFICLALSVNSWCRHGKLVRS